MEMFSFFLPPVPEIFLKNLKKKKNLAIFFKNHKLSLQVKANTFVEHV